MGGIIMKDITPEIANRMIDAIKKLEEDLGPLYVALEFPYYQEFLGNDNVAFDEDGDFLLVPAKQYVNKITKI